MMPSSMEGDMRASIIALCVLAVSLSGCERRGNLRTAREFTPLPPPEVANPYYDPYASPGAARARWRPAVIDRRGTVVAPGRAEGGEGAAGRATRPSGTF